MPFRSQLEALVARRDALRTGGDAAQLAAVEAEIDAHRAEAARLIVGSARGAFSCPARWEAMVGDGPVRECGLCDRKVYDLTGLTATEAAALLVAHEGELCARAYRRRDGRLITSDCLVGRARQRRGAVAVAGAALAAVGLAAVPSSPPARALPRIPPAPAPVDDDGAPDEDFDPQVLMGAVVFVGDGTLDLESLLSADRVLEGEAQRPAESDTTTGQ